MFALVIIALVFCGIALLVNVLVCADSLVEKDEKLMLIPSSVSLILAIIVFSLLLGRF